MIAKELGVLYNWEEVIKNDINDLEDLLYKKRLKLIDINALINELNNDIIDMNNQFTLFGHSGGISNIPTVQELAKELGVSVESLEGSLSTGQFSIKQLQIANKILSGDLMTIKDVNDFVATTKFKQFTPELESDRLELEKAREQDENFASIFRDRYMGSGISIDKTLLELGKLEGDRKKRFDSKKLTFIDGIGFDLTSETGLKEHQKYMQAKFQNFIPETEPLDFAGISNLQS